MCKSKCLTVVDSNINCHHALMTRVPRSRPGFEEEEAERRKQREEEERKQMEEEERRKQRGRCTCIIL